VVKHFVVSQVPSLLPSGGGGEAPDEGVHPAEAFRIPEHRHHRRAESGETVPTIRPIDKKMTSVICNLYVDK
jgi:hypothetical protein